MKAKSFSRKILNRKEKHIVNLATNYLLNCTKKELGKYRDEPVVIQVGNHGFLVGNFKIDGKHKDCWVTESLDSSFQHSFISKANAILYCMCEVTKRYDAAKELLDLDSKIGKLENDILQYQHIMAKSKDPIKTKVILNRYFDARYQYKAFNDILKKTLKSAKYSKFGNQTI